MEVQTFALPIWRKPAISDASADALRVPRLPRPSVSRLLPTLITARRQAGSGCSGYGCGRSADTQAPYWMRKVVCAAHHHGYRARESARMRTGGDPETRTMQGEHKRRGGHERGGGPDLIGYRKT